MESFIGLHEGDPAPTIRAVMQRVANGAFEEASRSGCAYPLERQFPLEPGMAERFPACAGLIAFLASADARTIAARLAVPVVNTSNSGGELAGIGNVLSDDRAVGIMAADYLLDQGYSSFLVLGQEGRVFSDERAGGFQDRVAACGATSVRVDIADAASGTWSPGSYREAVWEQARGAIERLPPAAGVFAVSDWIAWPILGSIESNQPERCHTLAVLGVDNLGDSAFDPRKTAGLSSVATGFRRVGSEALRALVAHLEGRGDVARVSIRCAPERVVERISTAGFACADPPTAEVLRAMWKTVAAEQEIDLAALAGRAGLSLRLMEMRFSRHLGRSAREFLVDLRIRYGKRLLADPGTPVSEIAIRCGYSDPAAFSHAFKRVTGFSPLAWKAQMRGGVTERAAGSPVVGG